MREVAVTVTETGSGKPAGITPLRVTYSYDYEGYFVLRTPKELVADTDENGRAVLKLADYRWAISLDAGGASFALNKKLIQKGGTVEGSVFNSLWPEMRLRLEPVSKRPASAETHMKQ
jgi:hypothetical protein